MPRTPKPHPPHAGAPPLSARLAELLDRSGLTREEVARRAEVPVSAIRAYATGRTPSPGVLPLLRIARVLGVSLSEFDGCDAAR